MTTLPSSFQSFEFALHYRDSATSSHGRKYEVVIVAVVVIIVVVDVIIVIIVAVVVVFLIIVFVVVVLNVVIVVVVVDGAIAIIMSSSFPCYLPCRISILSSSFYLCELCFDQSLSLSENFLVWK